MMEDDTSDDNSFIINGSILDAYHSKWKISRAVTVLLLTFLDSSQFWIFLIFQNADFLVHCIDNFHQFWVDMHFMKALIFSNNAINIISNTFLTKTIYSIIIIV